MFFNDSPFEALLSAVRAAMGTNRVVLDQPTGRWANANASSIGPSDPVRTSATRHLPPIEPRPDREETAHVHHVESVTTIGKGGKHEERCHCGARRTAFRLESGRTIRPREWRTG